MLLVSTPIPAELASRVVENHMYMHITTDLYLLVMFVTDVVKKVIGYKIAQLITTVNSTIDPVSNELQVSREACSRPLRIRTVLN